MLRIQSCITIYESQDVLTFAQFLDKRLSNDARPLARVGGPLYKLLCLLPRVGPVIYPIFDP